MSTCPLLANQFTPAAAGPSLETSAGVCSELQSCAMGDCPPWHVPLAVLPSPSFLNQPLFPLRRGRGGTAPRFAQPSSVFAFVAHFVARSPDGCPASVGLFVSSTASHCGEPGGAGVREPGSRWCNNTKRAEMSGGGTCGAVPSDQNQLLRQQSCENKPLGAPLAWCGSSFQPGGGEGGKTLLSCKPHVS